jgi:hypothetical protein
MYLLEDALMRVLVLEGNFHLKFEDGDVDPECPFEWIKVLVVTIHCMCSLLKLLVVYDDIVSRMFLGVQEHKLVWYCETHATSSICCLRYTSIYQRKFVSSEHANTNKALNFVLVWVCRL